MKTSVSLQLLLCVLCISVAVTTHATPIDLNDFFFFAGDPVTIAPDGSSATIGELAGVSPVVLSNDPGLGDPQVIIAGSGVSLVFDYNFVEGSGSNDDEFGAFILDSNGISAGPAFEFFTQSTSSGTVSFDPSGLIGEPFIGLQFQLSALSGDADFNSIVTVSSVRLESTAVIPEPSTVFLFGIGVIGILGYGWRRRKRVHR